MRGLVLALLASLPFQPAIAQVRVSGHVVVKHTANSRGNSANVVVSLVPLHGAATVEVPAKPFRLAQKNKTFEPHLLVIPVGSTVEFPNLDPFFHNVFSLYNGKRFDLGLYEAGGTRSVKFTRPGISYVFCNIHPQMSAVVIAMETPYYAVTGVEGDFSIPDVPAGQYTLRVWYERATAEELAKASREVTVSPSASLPPITITEAVNLPLPHKNKYGRDYDTESPYEPIH